MKFQNRLKDLRIQHGLTQEELGAMLGVTGANCTRYEKGLSQPKIATLVKMSQIFGVSVDYLLGIDEQAADTEEGRKAAAAYWSKQLAPEFKLEYREGNFYLIALQNTKLPLTSVQAGVDFKFSIEIFNAIMRNIQGTVERALQTERKKAALNHFKFAAEMQLTFLIAASGAYHGATEDEIINKLYELWYKKGKSDTGGE